MHPTYCNQVPNNFKSSCSCLPNPYGMNQYIDGDNFFPGISNPEYSMNCNCSFTKPNFPGNFPLPFNHLQHLNIRYSLFNLNQWYQFYHSHQYGQQKILTTEEDEEPLDLSLKTLSNINGSSSQQHQHDYDDDHHHHHHRQQQQQSQQADHLLQLNQIPINKSFNDCWYHQMESLKIPSTYSMEVYNTSFNKSIQNNTLSSYTNVIQKSNELTQCTFNVKINKSKSIKQLNIQQTNKFNLTKPIKRSYTEVELSAAVKAICFGRLGTRRAASVYGIPRSTLRNKICKLNELKKVEEKRLGGKSIVLSQFLLDLIEQNKVDEYSTTTSSLSSSSSSPLSIMTTTTTMTTTTVTSSNDYLYSGSIHSGNKNFNSKGQQITKSFNVKETKSSSQRNCSTYLMHTANRVASIFQVNCRRNYMYKKNLDHKSKTGIEKSVYSKKKKKSTSMHKLHCSQSTIN
ncbi:Mushroom body large-type Kenyon cell-specific protein [Schistosoma japonicum]|uniref:Mushroom body large-type Kenyon cell-specific protein n=1 Tax=Schistosoma japonicum TaxID=6182 RepID=A0A4Z2CUV4_SCHJA|nr:Mushroom body large-type Kenyon cell-specific protein [Schistosoma japonicum]